MITGAPETIDGQNHLVLTRTFKAPISDVWAALTESERLARWFCTWTGDPASGRVEMTWAFEDDMPTETYAIEACEAPQHLRVRSLAPDGWTLDARLSENADVTTLRFLQVLTSTSDVTDVGPGWEFYLDRLEESVRTGGVATTRWQGYAEKSAEYAAAFAVAAPDPETALLETALRQLGAAIEAGRDRPDATTPCEDWTVQRLSEHVVATTALFARAARGEPVDFAAPAPEVPGDVAHAFAVAAKQLRDARAAAGAQADPPDMVLAELSVHTWDLATALGLATDDLDQQVAERGGTFMRAQLTDEMRGRQFRPAQPEPTDGNAYSRLAAFAGRSIG